MPTRELELLVGASCGPCGQRAAQSASGAAALLLRTFRGHPWTSLKADATTDAGTDAVRGGNMRVGCSHVAEARITAQPPAGKSAALIHERTPVRTWLRACGCAGGRGCPEVASPACLCRSVLLEYYGSIGDEGQPEDVARLRSGNPPGPCTCPWALTHS